MTTKKNRVGLDRWRDGLRDARDILRHTRSLHEILTAIVPGRQRPTVLNDRGDRSTTSGVVDSIEDRLAALRRQLQAEVVTAEGRVDYRRLIGGQTYTVLQATSAALVDAQLELDSDAARMAFWINLYNVLVVHGVVALGIRQSVMEVPSFFARVAYRVAGQVLTLDEIENGVLRRNAPHPVTGKRPFKPGDPRNAFAPSRLDPRIHAALVCAAHSCPPIAMYDSARLDEQLALASSHLVDSASVDDKARIIILPLVFRWYARDFEDKDGLRGFLLRHARGDRRAELERAIANGYSLTFSRYDWRLNAAP